MHFGGLMESMNKWKELGNYIRDVRKDKGISTYFIEKEFGFSRQYWSRIELASSEYALKPELLQRIATILKINYLDLYVIVGYADETAINEFSERKKQERNINL